MKIGLVLPSIPGYSETFFRNKILGLQQNGHDVILFVNNFNLNSQYQNCKVISAPKLNGNKFSVFWNSLVQLLKAIFVNPKRSLILFQLNKKDGITFFENVKTVLANQFLLDKKLNWLHFGFGTMALERENVAQAIDAKMAVSFRGFDHYVYPIKNKDCYKVLFSKNVKYHVLSEGMKHSLLQNGITADKIVKITPAIDVGLFSKSENVKANSILQIVTISRLHWIKGLDSTLEALALLKQKGIPFQYTLVGDGVEKERLQFAVHQLGLVNEVTFAGKLPPQAVKEVLQNADIYLQYSIQEGFCNAVLEAQAMGKLCIVSDAEGLYENVIDGVTGFVVPKRNPVSLAEKIVEVSKISSLEKEAMEQKAIERIKKEFAIEKQVKAFISFYNL